LLLEFIKTDAGTDNLASALKDRYIRTTLERKSGVRIEADYDIYRSLPSELRVNVRSHFLEGLKYLQSLSIAHRRRFPRKSMSPYASLDTEWRALIEAIVFRSVCLRNDKQDLDCFVRYVVGNRRHHVRHISLPCVAWDQKSGMDAVFTDTISRLFAYIAQWHDVATGCRAG